MRDDGDPESLVYESYSSIQRLMLFYSDCARSEPGQHSFWKFDLVVVAFFPWRLISMRIVLTCYLYMRPFILRLLSSRHMVKAGGPLVLINIISWIVKVAKYIVCAK